MSGYPECPICLDIYGTEEKHEKAPKILICGHTFCKECLLDLINRSKDNFILCPKCKKNTEIKQNIEEYTTNFGIIDLVNASFRIPKDEIEKGEGIKNPKGFQIISLGNSGVGKTCIFKRLLGEKFSELYIATLGIQFSLPYYIKYKNFFYELFFCDTCGMEKTFSITKNYVRNSDGVLFVYDISDRNSFEDLNKWYALFKEEKGEVVGVLIGNKSDKERQVDYNEAKKFADEHELKYFETSAKLDKNIKKAIVSLLDKIINSQALYDSVSAVSDFEGFKIDLTQFKKESFCERYCKNFLKWFK